MITVPDAGHDGVWEEEYKEKMVSFFIKVKNNKVASCETSIR